MERRDINDSSIFAVPGQLIVHLGSNVEDHVDAMELARETAFRAYCLIIVAEEAPAPDRTKRDELQPCLNAILKDTKATAVVIQGGGIQATTKRTLIRVMASFSHSPKPFRIFAALEGALLWLRGEASNNGDQAFCATDLPESFGGVIG